MFFNFLSAALTVLTQKLSEAAKKGKSSRPDRSAYVDQNIQPIDLSK
jgi:hypothetical protein